MKTIHTLKLLKFVPLAAAALLTFSCSKSAMSSADMSESEVYYESRSQQTSPAASVSLGNNQMASRTAAKADDAYETAPVEPAETTSGFGRKLVKQAHVRIRVEKLEVADASVADMIQKSGSYTASSEFSDNVHRYIIRVPSQEYDSFLAGTEGMGKILRRTENTEDVTLRYFDLEGRLATKKELLKTFQSYLGRAANIEEILDVETRIAELQDEIDGTGRELRNLANRVEYASVELVIMGPESSYHRPDLGMRIGDLFSDFGDFLTGLAVVIVGIVIYGIPILLILVFFFWLLFGRVGLLKKLFIAATGKRKKPKDGDGNSST